MALALVRTSIPALLDGPRLKPKFTRLHFRLLAVCIASYPLPASSESQMEIPRKADPEDPLIVTQFYYSQTFPYLIKKWQEEIRRRLKDVPEALRRRELVPQFEGLDITSGDAAWQVFRNYLDSIERCIAEIVRGHSPSYWFHLHRRLRPMLAEIHESKTDDTTVNWSAESLSSHMRNMEILIASMISAR